jgi:hypothetical protein
VSADARAAAVGIYHSLAIAHRYAAFGNIAVPF